MVREMIRKNIFYILLLIIFLLVISRDKILGFTNNKDDLKNYFCELKSNEIIDNYEKLNNLLEIDTNDKNIIFSRMLNRNIYEFYEKLEINKGSINGIKKNDLVINEKGVIGLIGKVNENTSEVILLTNHDINLSVKVGDSYGILSSNDHKIFVKNIKLTEEVKEGDEVVTSGLTEIMGGIPIGRVKEIKKDNLDLEYILEIDPFANYKEIKYLGVII